jgi:signal transduction histidine kinase
MLQLKTVLDRAVKRFQRTIGTDVPVKMNIQVDDGFEFNTNGRLLGVCLERIFSNAYESFEGDSKEHAAVELTVRLTTEDQLEMLVMDRGKGIDPGLKDSIFEPFVTSSSTIGRGMGLTIARHSINCLGGSIEALDREGGGTTIRILLPLAEEVPDIP